ncbi:MAG TPA: hypothetical protein VNT29_04935 [Candidatus Limnocylindrales bacterium]|nr:hypothetical protein [Candidatus Limnocylindrales bacterium]
MKHIAKNSGAQLFRKIQIRVFSEHNAGSQLFWQNARPGHGFTEYEIDRYLESVADQVEKRFPTFEYELVRLGQAHFNFVWKGYRKASGTQEAAQA